MPKFDQMLFFYRRLPIVLNPNFNTLNPHDLEKGGTNQILIKIPNSFGFKHQILGFSVFALHRHT